MEKKNFYDTIFKRKSIRNYDQNPLDEENISSIQEYMDNLTPLFPDIETELKIVSGDEIKTRMMKRAPHYIAVFSENKEGYLTNIGYMLQQMDLFLSDNGIGCCWQGIPKPKKEVLKSSKLEFIILLAFGKPKEALYRSSVSEFKRKSMDGITDIEGANNLLEAARIAPSATNSQPWFFTGSKNNINVYCVQSKFLKARMLKKLNQIDMGIGIFHIVTAAEHFGKSIEIIFDKTARDNPPEGYYYIVTLKIE
ncbi:nitroreductase family protein [Methanobacterium aggregans]|uniref:nitroreductase family protein n=1 Tax=Methanobacterium aggregans TaxID=1615586 RepID=UPI001AE6FF7A|nr:nitroreductase family protein [Methanobacterium aggregans]MBP2045364.1 nitroreductase [Methanobacterium aggregans]